MCARATPCVLGKLPFIFFVLQLLATNANALAKGSEQSSQDAAIRALWHGSDEPEDPAIVAAREAAWAQLLSAPEM